MSRWTRLFVIGLFFGVAAGLSGQAIRLAIGEWPPYFSEKMKESGVFAHIVKEAFAREGVAVSYEFYPWKRALLLAEQGTVAGSPGWISTPERAQTLLFSDPVVISKEVLFYDSGRPIQFTTLKDLKGLSIGAAIGYSYGDAVDKAEASGELTLDRRASDEQNLRMLLAGRVDAVALNRAVGFELLQSFSPEDRAKIVASPNNLSEKPSRLAMGKAYPNAAKLMATFNRGLAKVVQDGTAAAFLADAENGGYELGR